MSDFSEKLREASTPSWVKINPTPAQREQLKQDHAAGIVYFNPPNETGPCWVQFRPKNGWNK